MKQLSKILMMVGIILVSLSILAYAIELERTDSELMISGTAEANTEIRLAISDSDGMPVYVESLKADAFGVYQFPCTLPFYEIDQAFHIYINGALVKEEAVAGTQFIVTAFQTVDADTVNRMFSTYAKRIGFPLEGFYRELEDQTMVGELFDGSTVQNKAELVTSFQRALAIAAVNQANRSNLLSRLESCQNELGIDYEKDLSGLSTKKSQAFILSMLEDDYDSISTFLTGYSRALGIAKNTTEGTQTNSNPQNNISGVSKSSESMSFHGVDTSVTPLSPISEYVEAEQEVFNDISHVDWAKESILRLYEKGVIKGRTEDVFAPDDFVKREEFVSMVTRLFGLQVTDETVTFSDVTEDAWFRSAVMSAVSYGIITGISEDTFGSGREITRQDCAVICYRIAKKQGLSYDGEVGEKFADPISDYAKEAIYAMKQLGVMNGIGENLFDAEGTCTRAMAAKIIDKFGECME